MRGKASEFMIVSSKLVYSQPNYSSAFEVSINNELVWSKLQTGNIPTLDQLYDIICFDLPEVQISVFWAILGVVLFGFLMLVDSL